MGVGSGAMRWAVWWLLMGGCTGPDLAEYEVKQAALEKEVAVLRQTVAEMRGQMQEMGMIPAGPAAGSSMTVTGAVDLSSEIPFAVERTGEIPTFPALGDPERRDTTDCGYRFSVPWLESISDGSLESSGSGRASPILLLQDGRALTPHAGPVQYEKTCKFSFRHQPRYLFFSPADSVEEAGGLWEMQLSDLIPLPRSDEREMYWIYPGTTAVFRFKAPWKQEDWGPLQVEIDARVLQVGSPEAPNALGTKEALVSVLGHEERSAGPKLGFAIAPDPTDQPFTLEVSSPEGGPFVLLETLIVGNEKYALIVTAPGATSSTAPGSQAGSGR